MKPSSTPRFVAATATMVLPVAAMLVGLIVFAVPGAIAGFALGLIAGVAVDNRPAAAPARVPASEDPRARYDTAA